MKETVERIFGVNASQGEPEKREVETPSPAQKTEKLRADINLMQAASRQCYREIAKIEDEIGVLRRELEDTDKLLVRVTVKMNRIIDTVRACVAALIIIAMNTAFFVFSVVAGLKPGVFICIGIYAVACLIVLYSMYRLEGSSDGHDR